MTDITEETPVLELAPPPPPTRPPRRPKRRRTSSPKRLDAVQITGAALIAVGVALVLTVWIGWRSPLAVVGVAYGTFVAVVGITELVARRETKVIDLVVDEPAAAVHAGDTAVLPVVTPPVETPSAPASSAPAPDAVAVPDDPALDRPRQRRRFRRDDIVVTAFAALSAAAFTEVVRVVYHQRSLVGTVVCWYVAFIVLFALITRERSDAETALDRIVTFVVWSVGTIVAATLVWMLVYLFFKGLKELSLSFFTEDMSKVGPLNPGGGVKHAIIGTFEQVGIATVIVVPIAILTAVYLHEVRGRLAVVVRFIVDAMAGVPSIVAGLLVFTVMIDGHGFSGIGASAALVVLMLPTVTRASEEILRTIPDALREGALALGSPQHRVVSRVVLPTALTGLVTASILGVARAIGETAPLLLTAFGTDSTNWNPLKGPQSALPLYIWKLINEPDHRQNDRAWSALFVLVALVLVLFVTARLIASRGQRKLGRAR